MSSGMRGIDFESVVSLPDYTIFHPASGLSLRYSESRSGWLKFYNPLDLSTYTSMAEPPTGNQFYCYTFPIAVVHLVTTARNAKLENVVCLPTDRLREYF
jgi:hypothetical protein